MVHSITASNSRDHHIRRLTCTLSPSLQVPGQMIGSSAVVTKACTTCVNGVDTNQYAVDGKLVSETYPAVKLPIAAMEGYANNASMLTASFEVPLSAADAVSTSVSLRMSAFNCSAVL